MKHHVRQLSTKYAKEQIWLHEGKSEYAASTYLSDEISYAYKNDNL